MIVNLLLRILPLWALLRWAGRYGEMTLQHVWLDKGRGWVCSIRSTGPGPRYAWRETALSMRGAVRLALSAARGNPIEEIKGTPDRPVLGEQEFDDA